MMGNAEIIKQIRKNIDQYITDVNELEKLYQMEHYAKMAFRTKDGGYKSFTNNHPDPQLNIKYAIKQSDNHVFCQRIRQLAKYAAKYDTYEGSVLISGSDGLVKNSGQVFSEDLYMFVFEADRILMWEYVKGKLEENIALLQLLLSDEQTEISKQQANISDTQTKWIKITIVAMIIQIIIAVIQLCR